MAYYNGKKVVFSPHYHSATQSETISVKITIDPESRGEFTVFDVYGTKIDDNGALVQFHSGNKTDELQGEFVKNTCLLIKKSTDLRADYADLPSFESGNDFLGYLVDDSLMPQPFDTNLMKINNGTYSVLNRSYTVTNGEIVCNVSDTVQITTLIPVAALDSSYYLPAGTYNFSVGVVSQSTSFISNPYIRFEGTNGETYDFAEGEFTLPVAAKIVTLQNGSPFLLRAGMNYTIRPKITLANLEIQLIAE